MLKTNTVTRHLFLVSYGAECYRHSSWIFVTNVEKFIQECSNMRKISIFFNFFLVIKSWGCALYTCAPYTRDYTVIFIFQCIHNMLSGENQTDGNTLERFLTPYQYSTLPLMREMLFITTNKHKPSGTKVNQRKL